MPPCGHFTRGLPRPGPPRVAHLLALGGGGEAGVPLRPPAGQRLLDDLPLWLCHGSRTEIPFSSERKSLPFNPADPRLALPPPLPTSLPFEPVSVGFHAFPQKSLAMIRKASHLLRDTAAPWGPGSQGPPDRKRQL